MNSYTLHTYHVTMTRTDETEAPGVSDTLPQPVKKVLGQKPSLHELAYHTYALQSPDYRPLQYKPRPLMSNTKELNLTEPYQYYDLFVPSDQFSEIAEYTNDNALKNLAQQHSAQAGQDVDDGVIETVDDVGPLKARPWHNTTAAEIGVFVGILLLAGVSKNPAMKNFWSLFSDTGRIPDICSVRPLHSKVFKQNL